MKIAIVHDDLMRKAGGEQVVLSFHRAFPNAPIYTLCYDPDNTYPEFKNCDIRVTWFNKIAKNEAQMKKRFFPLGILAMKQHNFSEYDVLLISTTFCAKYISVSKNTKVFAYCHTPFRFAWRTDSYDIIIKSSLFKKTLYYIVASIMRKVELQSIKKINYFITNSQEVLPRIVESYKVKSSIEIIPPPVKMDNFYISENRENDYYLVVSRLEPYKRVDLAIHAFNKLENKKLIIVGKGPLESSLKQLAISKNIEFKGGVNADDLAKYYSNSKALIFPQIEDFGITPLEANASGIPVIALGKGGVLDTMIEYKDSNKKATALFFQEQTVDSLIAAIEKFETIEQNFDLLFIRENALRFSEESFIKKIQDFISQNVN